ncbi:odorant receptor 13a-like [Linepithema humile]|uniref:odorant receptor 13a-like n=1 Tax=Linepithema humile TaxID=83485 RepID=UPI00351E1D44
MKSDWNSGMEYGFSELRKMMWILGIWPLQKNDLVCTFRYLMILILESLTIIVMLIESYQNCGNAKDSLEMFLFMEASFHALINVISSRFYMKKIAKNVNSAVDDWSFSLIKKNTNVIMARYARIGRVIVVFQPVFALVATLIYYFSIITANKQQVVIIGNNTVILWNFILPATCFFSGISYSMYKLLLIIQLLQLFILFISECAIDSFFFAITMHLCGQLELLRIHFNKLGKKINEKNHYRNNLRSWIKRHYELIALAKNIEDSFNIIILIRMLIITFTVAISGIRCLVSFKHQNYTDVIKSIMFIQYYTIQSFLFTHAGDTLQNQSESIVSAIYNTTWHELPYTAVKDLILIMMRTKIPLQLTAGKFFFITRRTTTDILKTAVAYISFLQVTMEV